MRTLSRLTAALLLILGSLSSTQLAAACCGCSSCGKNNSCGHCRYVGGCGHRQYRNCVSLAPTFALAGIALLLIGLTAWPASKVGGGPCPAEPTSPTQ